MVLSEALTDVGATSATAIQSRTPMTLENLAAYLIVHGIDLAIRIGMALALWTLGRWIIRIVGRLITKSLSRSGKIDTTVARYIVSIVSVVLTIGLVMGMLDLLGIQTTSFAALIAGAGLAIGTAWGGLLTHFAAGVFMQVLRPFRVGDYITAGGLEGTVTEIGLFGTTLLSPDNVITIVGNNKIFSDVIKNFSRLPYRRVDCTAKIANGVDPQEAIRELRAAIQAIPNVLSDPPPIIDVLELTAEGPRLCIRPYCSNSNYGQVFFDTNRAIVQTLGAAAYPVPATPVLHLGTTATDPAAR